MREQQIRYRNLYREKTGKDAMNNGVLTPEYITWLKEHTSGYGKNKKTTESERMDKKQKSKRRGK